MLKAFRYAASLRRRSVTVVLAALTMITALIVVPPVEAAPVSFQMPFPCNETWHASTYPGHLPSVYAVDWNLMGSEDHHKPVLAGVTGTATVHYMASGLGKYVDVNAGGGWVTRYAHLETVSILNETPVTPLTQIGTVGATGLTGSPPPYHLHYEQRFNGLVQPASFNGTAISYVDSYNTPNPYTSANCPTTTATSSRFAVVGTQGGVWDSVWPYPLQSSGIGPVTLVAASPNRLAVIGTDNTAYLKDYNSSNSVWQAVAANVKSVAITDTRIVVLGTDGGVWAGDISNPLQYIAGPVKGISLSPSRLMVIGTDNTAYIRVGPITASGWARSIGGVVSGAVTDDRLAVVGTSGGVWATEGQDVNGTTYFITSPVLQVSLGSNRLAILGTDNTVYVREGPITGTNWTTVASNVTAVSLAGSLVAVRGFQGGVWAGIQLGALSNVANDVALIATG